MISWVVRFLEHGGAGITREIGKFDLVELETYKPEGLKAGLVAGLPTLDSESLSTIHQVG